VKVCTVEGCGRKHKARGMCSLHYRHWWRQQPRVHLHTPSLLSWGVPIVRTQHNQVEARRVAAWIEANSPMTLQQFEAGIRRLEGAP